MVSIKTKYFVLFFRFDFVFTFDPQKIIQLYLFQKRYLNFKNNFNLCLDHYKVYIVMSLSDNN
jgi:hypothetical protein